MKMTTGRKNRDQLRAALAMGTLATGFGMAMTGGANAIPCPKIVSVPFVWGYTQTIGPTLNNTSVFDTNSGPTTNVESDSANLAGHFNIMASHTPPANFCDRLDPLPTNIGFSATGLLSGSFSDTTLNATIGGFGIVGSTVVTAGINVAGTPLGPFTGLNLSSPGSGVLNESHSAPFTVGNGTILSYTGDVNTVLTFGIGSGTLGDFQSVFAQILVGGAFIGPTRTNIRYTLPVPLPAAGLLMVGGLGVFAAMGRRDRRRRRTSPSVASDV